MNARFVQGPPGSSSHSRDTLRRDSREFFHPPRKLRPVIDRSETCQTHRTPLEDAGAAKVNQFQTRRRFRRLNSWYGAPTLANLSHYYPTYGGWKHTTRESDAASCLPRTTQDPFSRGPPLVSSSPHRPPSRPSSPDPPPSISEAEVRCSNFVLRRNSP